jgi:hypothetical protein
MTTWPNRAKTWLRIGNLKALLAPPRWAAHRRAEHDTARRELVQGATGVPLGGRGGMSHGTATHIRGRDTCAAHTSPLRLHATMWV